MMADSSGPGSVSGVSGTPALRRLTRSGQRQTRRQRRLQEEEEEKKSAVEEGRSRKGRYLDERA